MSRLLNRQELMHEIRTTLVQICAKAVSEGFVARVEGLIGITLDNNSVFLVNIQENFIDPMKDNFPDHQPSSDPSFNDHKVDASKTFHADDSGNISKPNLGTHQVAESQKEVSKLDMLMRYSSNLFDQFMSNSNNKRQKMLDYPPARGETRVNSQRQQLCLSNDPTKEIHPSKEFQPHASTREAEFSFSDQGFSVKEEPLSQASFDDSVNCGEMSGKVLTWPCHLDRLASFSKSSSTSQCQQGAQKIDNYGEVASPADQKPNENPGFEYLPQPWMLGNSSTFETFGTQNDFGENPESRPYVCELCDASFSKKFCLANHIVTIHQVGGKYVCKHCGKQFLQKLRYLTHVDRHNNVRRHVCQLCGKAFSYKYSLWSHSKKCLGNLPGLNEPMFSAQAGPTFSTQAIDGTAPVEDATET